MGNNKKNYEIRKKYCPAMRQNVIFKVFETDDIKKEECINMKICGENGGCKNSYININSNPN